MNRTFFYNTRYTQSELVEPIAAVVAATNHDRIDNLLLPPPQKHPHHQLHPPNTAALPTVVIERVFVSYFEVTNNEETDDTK